jgi:hypothetical protein
MPEEHPIPGQKSYRAIYRLGCLQFTHTRNASMGRALPSPKRQRVKPAWSRRNMIGLIVAVVLWLVAVALFRIGPLHGQANIAAVLCMFVFWIVLNGWGLRAVGTPTIDEQASAKRA